MIHVERQLKVTECVPFEIYGLYTIAFNKFTIWSTFQGNM